MSDKNENNNNNENSFMNSVKHNGLKGLKWTGRAGLVIGSLVGTGVVLAVGLRVGDALFDLALEA